MKRVVGFALAAGLLGPIGGLQRAEAADFGNNALRGSIQEPQAASLWDGFYVGGTAGYAAANVASSNQAQNMISQLLYGTEFQGPNPPASTFAVFNKSTTQSGSYGVFLGYNTTWDDVVVGFEADYQRTNLKTSASFSSPGVEFSSKKTYVDSTGTTQNYFAAFNENGSDKTAVDDIVTLRGRVGYAINNLLPFATIGLALAHGSRATTVNVQTAYYEIGATTPDSTLPYSASHGNRDQFAAGLAAGVGAEYAMAANLFLRAEYQYLKFPSFGGANIDLSIARVGAGMKF